MSCKFLSAHENGLVFQLVGRNCLSQCTSIVQLFQSAAPKHSKWLKKYTGALCFVKDSIKRSYYFRLYCLIRHEMMWEQEIYDAIKLSKPRPYLLTFEGQHGIIALNFAFDEEADILLQIVTRTVTARNKKIQERKPKQSVKETKKKFEIGSPCDVKHVMHVGWDGKRDFGLTLPDQKFKSLASHLVDCQHIQKGGTLPKRNPREPLPPLPSTSNKKPTLPPPNKSTYPIKTEPRKVKSQQEPQVIKNNRGGYIVKTVEKGKSKSGDNSAPDISNIIKMVLKAHNQTKSSHSITPDTSDSDEWD